MNWSLSRWKFHWSIHWRARWSIRWRARWSVLPWIAALILGLAHGAGAQPAMTDSHPVTRPSALPAAGRVEHDLRRAVQLIGRLDLSDDQRHQVQRLVGEVGADLRELAREHADDPEALAPAVRQRMRQFRRGLDDLLTPDQRRRLVEMLRAIRGRDEDPPAPPGPAEEDFATPAHADADAIAAGPTESRFLAALTAPTGLAVGEKIPQGLNVLTLQNRQIPLSLRLAEHRPTIVLLGSASSPTFRDRCGDLRWLISQLRSPSGRTADIVLIYTREQYPAGQWDLQRNVADGFVLPAHADAKERVETASNLRRWANLDAPGLVVVADTMDDAALTALAGSPVAVGNFAFVFAADGTLVARQQWFDPTGLPALVAQAAE